jgi:transcriptional regulator with XRE-family HTH domain
MVAQAVFDEDVPLAVLLFYAAMERNQSVSEFADVVGIGAISLRQLIKGETHRPRTQSLERISAALHMPTAELRRRLELAVEARPDFAAWMQARMKGRFSRAKLGQLVQISDGAMRNYLTGRSLPDADQAQRLAAALDVPSLDMARILVANQIVRSGGTVESPQQPAVPVSTTPQPQVRDMSEPPAALPDVSVPYAAPMIAAGVDEERLLALWRRLHPQARRATQLYIAGLLAES